MANLVSVIITCHNLERYIGPAIESVLAQDYQGNLDILVIDDCSTDRSAAIVQSYSGVRYVKSARNLGVLMATVHGLEQTTGELIFFLDGDDIWEKSKVRLLVDRFKSDSKLALLTHDLEYIDADGHPLPRNSRPSQVMGQSPSINECQLIRDGILLHSDYVWLGSAYAVHRTRGGISEFCDFSRSLPDSFNTYQDWPLAFWVACHLNVTVGYIPVKLFRYRVHGANYSGDASSVVKATRNFRRSHNTLYAIKLIADRFNVSADVHIATRRKLRFYEYLCDLYGDHRPRAIKGFFASLRYLTTGTSSFWKEAIRFVGVQALGSERFIRASRFTRHPGRS